MIELPPEMRRPTHKVNVMPSGAVVKVPVKKQPPMPSSLAKTLPIDSRKTLSITSHPTRAWDVARRIIHQIESGDPIEEAIDEMLEAD
jgi:hypothetical protein